MAENEGLRQAVKAATDQAALPASAMGALTPYWFASAAVNADAQAALPASAVVALTPAELAQLRAILALSQKTA